MKHDHDLFITGVKPEYDKKSRLIAVSHLIENGKCLFPNDNPDWWNDFEKEILSFPKAKHDDQVDALVQVLYHKIYGYVTPEEDIKLREEYKKNEAKKYRQSRWLD